MSQTCHLAAAHVDYVLKIHLDDPTDELRAKYEDHVSLHNSKVTSSHPDSGLDVYTPLAAVAALNEALTHSHSNVLDRKYTVKTVKAGHGGASSDVPRGPKGGGDDVDARRLPFYTRGRALARPTSGWQTVSASSTQATAGTWRACSTSYVGSARPLAFSTHTIACCRYARRASSLSRGRARRHWTIWGRRRAARRASGRPGPLKGKKENDINTPRQVAQ